MILIGRSLLLLALVFSGLRLEAGAQTPDSTAKTERLAWPVALIVTEAIVFGHAAVARSETGARVVGALEGISGLAILSVAALSDSGMGEPEFTVPYGVGLVALAYYNFRNADSPQRQERFWVNAIGLNVAALAGVASYAVFGDQKQGSSSMRSSPAVFGASIRF